MKDIWEYKRKFNSDGTEKHVVKEGARYHVIAYDTLGRICSESNCEINKERKKVENKIIPRMVGGGEISWDCSRPNCKIDHITKNNAVKCRN
jgi:hypothetical protein